MLKVYESVKKIIITADSQTLDMLHINIKQLHICKLVL